MNKKAKIAWNKCSTKHLSWNKKGTDIGVDEETTSNNPPVDTSEEKSKQKEKLETVPFHRLFSFTDSTDIRLMFVGTIDATGNGLGLHLMTLLFGQMINSFGSDQQTDHVVEVSKVSLKFVYLAVGSGVATFLRKV
ncbi:hypothetical protein RIF29_38542 [Crotalaria pallida]|uniref:Uncharacterized protein n=1 Tax=Crotalaria pallida TaxID=3830 RepID=A0AAN9E1C0_CROPI